MNNQASAAPRRNKIERPMSAPCEACLGRGHAVGSVLTPCKPCDGTGKAWVRCAQCWTKKPALAFMGKLGDFVKRCDKCQSTYKDWDKKTLEERERATSPRAGIRDDGPLRVSFVLKSGNRKTGPIPVTMSSARTCPRSCPLYNRGCYAEQHMVAMHWRRLSSGKGLTWREFCAKVESLPDGQIWRHNEAGDLPGDDEQIDVPKLRELIYANRGKRGWCYTHKSLAKYAPLFREANALGFVINISTDSLIDADRAAEHGLPVVTVLPVNAPHRGNKTPAGRTIVVCPAITHEHITCQSCKLCAVGHRKSIVAFLAHGDRKGMISERLRQLPMFKEAPSA